MSTTQPGFQIEGKTYPLVTLDEWRNQDFVLARALTRQPIEALVGPDGDRVLFQQALVGVAVHHGQPALGVDRVIDYVGGLKPGDVEEFGFDDEPAVVPTGGGTDLPPKPSSGTSVPPTVPTPEA
jgi:hypothetical protein